MKKSVLITGESGSLGSRLISAATAPVLEAFDLHSATFGFGTTSLSKGPHEIQYYNSIVESKSILIKSFFFTVTNRTYTASDVYFYRSKTCKGRLGNVTGMTNTTHI